MGLNLKVENHVLNITLNRPEVRNAFNQELILELTKAFSKIDENIRVVLLKGAGESFSAGADLEWMKSTVNFSIEQNQEDAFVLYDMFSALWNCPVPVVCQAHGHAFGGALGLLATSDFVALHESTILAFSEVKIGLVPAVISDFIRRRARMGRATSFMLSGQRFSAKQAYEMDLANYVGSSDSCTQLVQDFVKNCLASGPVAVRETKKLLRQLDSGVQDSRQTTSQVIARARVGQEGQEGLGAFLEKRRPAWIREEE